MRRQVLFGLMILFSVLFIITQSDLVDARPTCDSGGASYDYCEDLPTKNECLACGECEVYYENFSNQNDWVCSPVSRIGAQCIFYLTEEECSAQFFVNWGNSFGCIWRETMNDCVEVAYSGSPQTPIVQCDVNSPGPGLPCDGVIGGDANNYIGRDVFCSDQNFIQYKWAYCYRNIGSGSPERDSLINCTCYADDPNGEDIISPLVCLSYDTRHQYECPNGYHFYNISCIADKDWDGYFGTTIYEHLSPYVEEPGECQNFCSALSPTECNDFLDVCMLVDDGFCETYNGGSAGDFYCENTYFGDEAACTADAGNCQWYTTPDQQCVSKTGVEMKEKGSGLGANDCDDTDENVGANCPVFCHTDIDEDTYGNETPGYTWPIDNVPSCEEASPCSVLLGSNACGDVPGCTWDPASSGDGECVQAFDCGIHDGDSGACNGTTGCSWEQEGYCGYDSSYTSPISCGAFSPNCNGAPSGGTIGCTPSSNDICVGNPHCGSINGPVACENLGCLWDYEVLHCMVNGCTYFGDCGLLTDLACENSFHVNWCDLQTNNYCSGGVWECEDYTSGESTCENYAGCDWKIPTGTCENDDCSNNQIIATCESFDACSWNPSGLNSCQGNATPLVADNADCNDFDSSYWPGNPSGPERDCTDCPTISFSPPNPTATMATGSSYTPVMDLGSIVSLNLTPQTYEIINPSSNYAFGQCMIQQNTNELWCMTGGVCPPLPGTFNVTVRINANNGNCQSDHTITITSVDNNECPVMAAIPNIPTHNVCDYSTLFLADDYSSDADDDSLTYSVSLAIPSGIAEFYVVPSTSAVIPSGEASGGPVSANITANDGMCDSNAQPFTVLNFTNDAPTFSGIPTPYTFPNTPNATNPYGYYPLGYLPDYSSDSQGDYLTYSADTSMTDPLVGHFVLTGSHMFFLPAGQGTTTVDVYVEDCIEDSSQTLTITVSGDCPNMDALPTNYYLAESAPANTLIVDMALYVFDPDGDAITYSLVSSSGSAATCQVVDSELQCTPDAVGIEDVIVRASSNGCLVQKTVYVHVYALETCFVDADNDGFGNETESFAVSNPGPNFCVNFECGDFNSSPGGCGNLNGGAPGCAWGGGALKCQTIIDYDFISENGMPTWPVNNLGQTVGDPIWDCDDNSSELTYLCCGGSSYFVWQRSVYKGNMSNVAINDYPGGLEPDNMAVNLADDKFVGACCGQQTDCVYGTSFFDNGAYSLDNPEVFALCYAEGSKPYFGGGDDSNDATISMYCGDD